MTLQVGNNGANDQQNVVGEGDVNQPKDNDNIPDRTRYVYSINKDLDNKKLKKYRNSSYISAGVAIIAFAFGLFLLIKS